ncbi:Uncharacterized protein Adt_34471 [Abeliophyllum distichum]|uniref:F-box domain-containing protein n=1 Tax=Abeliophyllum distichum TaxID=126358 RepID=A0ABD1QZ62_9LAMI
MGFSLIDRLPKEVLFQIVSLLPLKEAVRTSILSTSWRALWTPYNVDLNFSSDQINSDEACQIMQVIGKFLQSCDIPELLNIFVKSVNTKEKPEIFAAKGVDKELYLEFFEKEPMVDTTYTLKLKTTAVKTS